MCDAARQARLEMVSIFSRIIADRRSGSVQADDFLQKIIDFRYKDETDPKTGKIVNAGRGFSDSEVRLAGTQLLAAAPDDALANASACLTLAASLSRCAGDRMAHRTPLRWATHLLDHGDVAGRDAPFES